MSKLTKAMEAELEALKQMKDEDIDLTDIPEIEDFSEFKPADFYRPIKQQLTVRIDSDVLHWLKKDGKGYQSRLNSILRKEMLKDLKQA